MSIRKALSRTATAILSAVTSTAEGVDEYAQAFKSTGKYANATVEGFVEEERIATEFRLIKQREELAALGLSLDDLRTDTQPTTQAPGELVLPQQTN